MHNRHHVKVRIGIVNRGLSKYNGNLVYFMVIKKGDKCTILPVQTKAELSGHPR